MSDNDIFDFDERCLANDDFFRYVVSVCPELMTIIAAAFLGKEWLEAKAISQADIPYGKNHITPDAALTLEHKLFMLEINGRLSFPNVVGIHHQKICAARISGLAKRKEVDTIGCLVLSGRKNGAGGLPSFRFNWDGWGGKQWPAFLLRVVDMNLIQNNKEQDEICHDFLVTRLRDMRNRDMINAIRKARPSEGDPMEAIYNDYSARFYERVAHEKSLEDAAAIVKNKLATVEKAARVCKVKVRDLREYIQTHKQIEK